MEQNKIFEIINGELISRLLTDEEIAEMQAQDIPLESRIADLKQKLLDTDYKAIKYAEGWLTDEEYEPIKQQRQEWREEINELEGKIMNHIDE